MTTVLQAPAKGEGRPGYKHTKLGWIPEEWEMNRIGPKIDLLVGYPFASTGYSQTGVRLLRCNNIKRGETSWDESVTVCWPKSSANLKRYEMQVGDLVIAMDGSLVGKSYALLSEGDLPALLLQRVARVRSKDIDTEYLKHWVGSNYFVRYCDAVKTVTAIPHIGHKDIQDWVLPIPPLPEQRRIAAVLGAWDRAIGTVQQLLAAQQERKRGLMQELLTGRRRFTGFGGKWKSHRLGDLFERVTRKNTVGEEHVLTISAQHGLIDQREIFNKSVAGANLAGYYLLKNGEFAYNKSSSNGYPVGAIKRLDRYDQGVLSTLYICFALKPGRANSDFMAAYFDAGMLDEGIGAIAQEGARNHGLLNVSTTDFFDLDVHIPDQVEQTAMAKAIGALNKETEAIQNYLNHLTTQKRGLMQQLLTGAVRVKY